MNKKQIEVQVDIDYLLSWDEEIKDIDVMISELTILKAKGYTKIKFWTVTGEVISYREETNQECEERLEKESKLEKKKRDQELKLLEKLLKKHEKNIIIKKDI